MSQNFGNSPDRLRFLVHKLEPSLLSYDRADFYIPDAFREEIAIHILLNEIVYRGVLAIPNTPLILGIQGSPGIGKSWQAEAVCAGLNVPVYRISGASLSGDFEGDSSAALIASYARAATDSDYPAVLLIEDIDTSSAASFGETTSYTVNRQLLCGALMNLADSPTRVEGLDRNVRRTAIVATGNDFAKLYQPLRRHGRMTMYHYSPTSSEIRLQVVALMRRVFPHVTEDDIGILLSDSPNKIATSDGEGQDDVSRGTISFFVALCSYASRAAILRLVAGDLSKQLSLRQMLHNIEAKQDVLREEISVTSIERLGEFARQLQQRHRVHNYVGEQDR